MMLLQMSLLVPALAIALFVRIGLRDMEIQKIANNDILALAVVGLANTCLLYLQPASAPSAWMGPVMGLALFVALFPFWLIGKIGAGDVKLLAVVPMVIGMQHIAEFGLLFLSFVSINVFIMRGTVLDGIPQVQRYVEFFGNRGIIPFGVPVSAAACIVLMVQMIYTFVAMS